MKKDIKSMDLDEVKNYFKYLNEPSYKAVQVYNWLSKGVTNFDEMTNISINLRNTLDEKFYISNAIIKKKVISKKDETIKYLLLYENEEHAETAVMKYKHGITVCVSTQFGCKMGCSFCATGKGGFLSNLTASQIINQVQVVQKDLGLRVSNIVLMGMGEPLDNFESVMKFVKIITSQQGMNIGARHVTLSTCGVADKIYCLADKKSQIKLSVSLHAPNDRLRNKIMPINKKYCIGELLKACEYYIYKTNKRISFEYTMINKFNDSESCAYELVKKIKHLKCHVNLIPVNKVEGENFEKSSNININKFANILIEANIPVTTRRTLGEDINAACGQLKFANDVKNVVRGDDS